MSSWDRLPSEVPWLLAGKNLRASHSKVKAGILKEVRIPYAECSLPQKARAALKYGVVGFYGLGNFIG